VSVCFHVMTLAWWLGMHVWPNTQCLCKTTMDALGWCDCMHVCAVAFRCPGDSWSLLCMPSTGEYLCTATTHIAWACSLLQAVPAAVRPTQCLPRPPWHACSQQGSSCCSLAGRQQGASSWLVQQLQEAAAAAAASLLTLPLRLPSRVQYCWTLWHPSGAQLPCCLTWLVSWLVCLPVLPVAVCFDMRVHGRHCFLHSCWMTVPACTQP
jgi:hypothetical protein